MPWQWLLNNRDDTKIRPRHTNLLSALPPSQTQTQCPRLLCLRQSRQQARKVIFETLSLHLAAHCFQYYCADPRVNSKHLCVFCCRHRERRSSRVGAVTHEYFCVITHWSIIDTRCWIKTIQCRKVFSLHLHMSQRKTSLLLWVNSPPQVTALNIHDVPLHNLPCQQKKRRGEEVMNV